MRLLTCGWETGHLNEIGPSLAATGVTLSASNLVTKNGAFSFRAELNVASGIASGGAVTSYPTGASAGTEILSRFWLYIDAISIGTDRLRIVRWHNSNTIAGPRQSIFLNANRTLQIGQGNAVIGSASSALATGQWHLVEASSLCSGTQQTVTLRVNGVAVGSQTVANANNDNIVQLGFSYGSGSTAGTRTATVYIDDLKINDSTGSVENSWPNDGELAFLLPDADSAVGTGWQKPGGATTNLFTSIDDTPPQGVADSTNAAQAENQIRNATTNNNYTASFPSYSSAGITGTVLGVHALAVVGAPVNTGAKTGSIGVSSNPSQTASSFGNYHSGANAAAFPTGWKYVSGDYLDSPTVTLGNSPTVDLNITGGTASRIALCCHLGLYVEHAAGAPTTNASGTASGVGSASAQGRSIAQSGGSAAGAASASAVGRAIVSAAGVASASGSASAVGSTGTTVSAAAGVASAAASASAVGVGINQSAGTAAGSGSASATGRAIASAVGTAASVGSASATTGSATTVSAAGVASASGSASATGRAVSSAAGSATGVGAASATSRAISAASGVAGASGAASAVSGSVATEAGAGTASGVGSASAQGVRIAQAAGVASATGSSSAVGRSTASASGAAAGTGSAQGYSTSATIVSAVGVASASGSTSAGARAVATSAGAASATGQASGGSLTVAVGTGIASASGSASGEARAYSSGAGMASGFGVAVGSGHSIAEATGVAEASGSAVGVAAGISPTPTPPGRTSFAKPLAGDSSSQDRRPSFAKATNRTTFAPKRAA